MKRLTYALRLLADVLTPRFSDNTRWAVAAWFILEEPSTVSALTGRAFGMCRTYDIKTDRQLIAGLYLAIRLGWVEWDLDTHPESQGLNVYLRRGLTPPLHLIPADPLAVLGHSANPQLPRQ